MRLFFRRVRQIFAFEKEPALITDVAIAFFSLCAVTIAALQYLTYRQQTDVMTRQLQSMTDSSRDSSEQAKELIAEVHKSADAAKLFSEAAAESAQAETNTARSSRDSVNKLEEVAHASLASSAMILRDAQADRRPWVSLGGGEVLQFSPGKALNLRFDIKNFGRTPALRVGIGAVAFPVMPGPFEYPQYADEYNRNVEKGLPERENAPEYKNPTPFEPIPPNGILDYSTPQGPVLSEQDITQIKAGKQTFYVVVRIVYRDLQGNPHQTIQCSFLAMGSDGKLFLAIAPFSNELD